MFMMEVNHENVPHSNVPHSNNFLFPLDKSNQDNLTIMNTVYV